MVFKKNSPAAAGHWMPGEGGYEATKSPELIKMALTRLREKRIMVVILHKGYQSGNTIIIGIKNGQLLIDKPVDWPGSSPSIRVVFRDEARVWNHFTVKVLAASQDTLKTQIPTTLFRLQRRSHFRIGVPMGCTASFTRKERVYRDAAIEDLSAGGVKISLQTVDLVLGEKLDNKVTDIKLYLIDAANMLKDDDDNDGSLFVARGAIVREIYDKERKCVVLGLEFKLRANEEKDLLKYVRQRELEDLRRGVKV